MNLNGHIVVVDLPDDHVEDVVSPIEDLVQEPVRHMCVHCHQSFPDWLDLDRHIKMYHDLVCPHCLKQFTRTFSLKVHLTKIHGSSLESRNEGNRQVHQPPPPRPHQRVDEKRAPSSFNCRQCGGTFANKRTLAVHVQRFHQKHVFRCTYCPKIFTKRENVHQHMKQVHNPAAVQEKLPLYACDFCEQVFVDNKSLGQHLEIQHTFPCPLCQKVFTRKQTFKNHYRLAHEEALSKTDTIPDEKSPV